MVAIGSWLPLRLGVAASLLGRRARGPGTRPAWNCEPESRLTSSEKRWWPSIPRNVLRSSKASALGHDAPTSLAPSVESRELCVMTRVARLFFIIAVMAAAGGCSVELAEKEADTKAMGRQLTDAYHSCVRTSSRRSGQQWSTAIWL
jgi:hypothetical protein